MTTGDTLLTASGDGPSQVQADPTARIAELEAMVSNLQASLSEAQEAQAVAVKFVRGRADGLQRLSSFQVSHASHPSSHPRAPRGGSFRGDSLSPSDTPHAASFVSVSSLHAPPLVVTGDDSLPRGVDALNTSGGGNVSRSHSRRSSAVLNSPRSPAAADCTLGAFPVSALQGSLTGDASLPEFSTGAATARSVSESQDGSVSASRRGSRVSSPLPAELLEEAAAIDAILQRATSAIPTGYEGTPQVIDSYAPSHTLGTKYAETAPSVAISVAHDADQLAPPSAANTSEAAASAASAGQMGQAPIPGLEGLNLPSAPGEDPLPSPFELLRSLAAAMPFSTASKLSLDDTQRFAALSPPYATSVQQLCAALVGSTPPLSSSSTPAPDLDSSSSVEDPAALKHLCKFLSELLVTIHIICSSLHSFSMIATSGGQPPLPPELFRGGSGVPELADHLVRFLPTEALDVRDLLQRGRPDLLAMTTVALAAQSFLSSTLHHRSLQIDLALTTRTVPRSLCRRCQDDVRRRDKRAAPSTGTQVAAEGWAVGNTSMAPGSGRSDVGLASDGVYRFASSDPAAAAERLREAFSHRSEDSERNVLESLLSRRSPLATRPAQSASLAALAVDQTTAETGSPPPKSTTPLASMTRYALPSLAQTLALAEPALLEGSPLDYVRHQLVEASPRKEVRFAMDVEAAKDKERTRRVISRNGRPLSSSSSTLSTLQANVSRLQSMVARSVGNGSHSNMVASSVGANRPVSGVCEGPAALAVPTRSVLFESPSKERPSPSRGRTTGDLMLGPDAPSTSPTSVGGTVQRPREPLSDTVAGPPSDRATRDRVLISSLERDRDNRAHPPRRATDSALIPTHGPAGRNGERLPTRASSPSDVQPAVSASLFGVARRGSPPKQLAYHAAGVEASVSANATRNGVPADSRHAHQGRRGGASTALATASAARVSPRSSRTSERDPSPDSPAATSANLTEPAVPAMSFQAYVAARKAREGPSSSSAADGVERAAVSHTSTAKTSASISCASGAPSSVSALHTISHRAQVGAPEVAVPLWS